MVWNLDVRIATWGCNASQSAENWRPLAVCSGFGGLRVRGGTAPTFQRVAGPSRPNCALLAMLVVLGPRLRAPLRRASVEEAGDKEHSTPSRPELLVLARAFQPPSVKDAARSPLKQRLRSHHVFFAAALATMRAWRAAAWLLGVFLAQLASVAAQDAR